MSKKKKHHKPRRKRAAPNPPRPVNPLTQRVEVINRMKPIVAAAQRTAARARERKQEREQEQEA